MGGPRWAQADKERVRAMVSAGASTREIMADIGRTWNQVADLIKRHHWLRTPQQRVENQRRGRLAGHQQRATIDIGAPLAPPAFMLVVRVNRPDAIDRMVELLLAPRRKRAARRDDDRAALPPGVTHHDPAPLGAGYCGWRSHRMEG